MNDTKLIRYLTIENDFASIAQLLLDELCMSLAEGVLLIQKGENDGDFHIVCKSGKAEFSREDEEAFKKLSSDVTTFHDEKTGRNYVFVPIYLRNSLAMYIGAFTVSKESEAPLLESVSQGALILQNIAARENFRDSLENSYIVMEELMNVIPIGLSVLNKDEKKVLMMNKVAEKSTAIQNAMGLGLCKYIENGETQIDEVYEEETGLWFDVKFRNVRWISGETVLLCTTIDVTQKVKNQQKIEYQANNDYLTGLFNRMKCERDLEEIIRKATENRQRGVVLFLDLDNFKQVNDGLGHQYGDILLQEIATTISSIPGIENSCYRMGGDEFVIIIEPRNFLRITEIVDHISKTFNEPWHLMEVEYFCTMSMGLAVFPDNGKRAQEAIKKADYAMYEAKKGGKNRYLWYDQTEEAEDKDKEALEADIRNAVMNDCKGFEVFFQPVTDKDGQICGAEALLRYSSEQFGALVPSKFIPIIEYLGLISYIGDFVFTRACETLVSWNKKYPEFMMHINISSVQLMTRQSVDNFISIINKTGVNIQNIVLDLSETEQFRDEATAFGTLDILRAHGIKVALDDFGTGNISLNLLKRLDTYVVKLDSSFVTKAKNDIYTNAVIRTIGELSKELGFKICFEGIESAEQLAFARDNGADFIEGFVYGKPISLAEFESNWING